MSAYITSLLFAIPIFIILIGLESFVAYRRGIQINHAADMISSLSSGLTNATRDGIQFGVVLISYTWLVNHITIYKVENLWLAVVIAFVVEDFAGYWIHRMSHRVNILWNRHVIHHSSEEYNLSCALRQSISDNIKFFSILLIPAAVMGIPPALFAIISPVHLFLQFWYHTRLIDKMGILENILVTPSHHRVHHAINPEYLDKNYSQIFIIWDKLFGTFQPEEKSNSPVYGILRPAKTWNPILINFKHLWQLTKDAYHANSYWDKIRIWFMPTGWRPLDVAEKNPVRTVENPASLKKYTTENSKFLLGWSYFQLFMTLTLMILIFFNMPILSKSIILLLGGLLAVHVMAYTLLLDGKKMAIALEGLKFVFGMVLFITLNERIGFVSSFSLNLILSYLFTSLGMTIYFFWIEIKSQQVIASVEP
ncbi:MAG: sterol desaturase family protein [Candidatus Marinimicrobia bacterium]|jgi:sterol desaturase/sphingolipid hydroxylase (fatty acid hydroxylase superfamily)|nr:sterol desaturase family protein [Candidatus Neomarinimicrobiota bacterium]